MFDLSQAMDVCGFGHEGLLHLDEQSSLVIGSHEKRSGRRKIGRNNSGS
jgi:hypothetical protein